MGLGDTDLSLVSSLVSCSICLEAVTDNGDRSTAKLQCGHEFHLDCIGSAFNVKGLMQCPNCRKIEKGQWLYANGCRSIPEFSMDDWPHEEDLYDLNYPEMTIGVHWCPLSAVAQLPSSFEEGESQSPAYHDLLGHHGLFAEHTVASSAAHSCPYVAYFPPLHPSSSNSVDGPADGPTFQHQRSGISGPTDTSHAFPAVDLQYHNWDHHSPPFSSTSTHISGADQASLSSATLRSTRADPDGLPRAGPFVHPFLHNNGSGSRASGSVFSSMVPPYLGNSRGQPRVHGVRPYHQHPIFSAVRTPSGPRGLPPGPPPSPPDHNGFYMFPSSGSSMRNLQEADNSVGNHFYAWERDQFAPYPLVPVDRESNWWRPFHPAPSGSDSGNRTGFWHNHGSERTSSQNRTENSNSSYHSVHPPTMHPFI